MIAGFLPRAIEVSRSTIMKEVQDIWFRRAKECGYRARSAFKLLQIDEKKHLLRRGQRVLDVGAAPGSWTQVAAERVGHGGAVVAFDLKVIDPKGLPTQVTLLQADLEKIEVDALGGVAFDVVLSDMGPDTSGDASSDAVRSARLCGTLLDRLPHWLRKGGSLVMKVYEGGEYPALLRRTERLFDEVKGMKPEASRRESVEMFIVGKGYRGEPASASKSVGALPRGW
ncbi:MAG: RlmE family RNA methyltransferase [Planctomycetes bacterium]|nr:RlmE family RNA methyltransferase [Planctomycetota bacterium]